MVIQSRFVGLWASNSDNILLIEYDKGNKFNVSFAPGKDKGPILRKSISGKPSLFMPAVWIDEMGSLIVNLLHEKKEPTLHLSYDSFHDYGEDDCLIPGLSTDYGKHNEQIQQVIWINPLEPYFRIPKEDQDKVTLFKQLNYYKNFKV